MTVKIPQKMDAFTPFDTMLDRDRALQILRDATNGADDGELFIERKRAEMFAFDDGRLKTASYDASEGFGLRAVKGETAGYAHATEISEAALLRAAQTARLAVGAGGATLADGPQATNRRLYTDENPMDGASFPAKVDVLKEIDDFARGLDGRVVQVSASMAASHQQVAILRPDGTLVQDDRPMTRINVSVMAEKDGRRESGTAGGGGRDLLVPLMERSYWEPLVREALRAKLAQNGFGFASQAIKPSLLGRFSALFISEAELITGFDKIDLRTAPFFLCHNICQLVTQATNCVACKYRVHPK